MELITIIYNSLLIVFALLSLIILSSLACSKLNLCGKNKRTEMDFIESLAIQKATFSEMDHLNSRAEQYNESEFNEIDQHEEKIIPQIDEKLIEQNKIKIVSRSRKRIEQFEEIRRKDFANMPSSRFMIVNRMTNDNNSNEINYKFSRMSVQYQQTA